jgi:hypothetical protein
MNGVIEGRIVHFVLESGEHRAAVVVRAWGDGGGEIGMVNLQVILDGTNDLFESVGKEIPPGACRFNKPSKEECEKGTAWRTSVHFSNEPLEGTWHWPEKVGA